MISEEQAREMAERVKLEALIFVESGYTKSDKEIAEEVNALGIATSASTVGRDLISRRLREMIGEDNYIAIQKHRQENQLKGRIIGGRVSQQKHGYSKDESGKFTGPKR